MLRCSINCALLLILITGIFSCGADEEMCDSPHLDKIDSKKVYYYENGLLAEYTWGIYTQAFSYSATGILTAIDSYSENIQPRDRIEIFYTEDHALDYVIRYDRGIESDSIQATLDEENRITFLAYYPKYNSLEDSPEAYQTIKFEYEGKNSTKTTIKTAVGEDQVMLIEYDNKPRPFPEEINLVSLFYTPFYWSVNNVKKIRYEFPNGFEQDFSMQYTGAGQVSSVTSAGATTRFSYTCNPRILKTP